MNQTNLLLIYLTISFSSHRTFQLFLSTEALGLNDTHNNIKSEVIALTRKLSHLKLTSKIQPPLKSVLSIDKLNSYWVNPETESDRYVLKDPKTLQRYESFRTPFEKVCDSPLKNDRNLETSISSKNIILNPIEVNINQINSTNYDRP